MKLSEWLHKNNTSAADFAESIDLSVQAAYKYIGGERIPRPEIMKRISEVTLGAVTPNDFYNIEAQP